MYAGTIRHRRFAVREHAFKYRLALAWRDLGTGRRGLMSRADVVQLAGPADDVRVLSHPFGFNPVAFYYGYGGGELRWIVAHVTNTPWGEKHAYVLGPRGGTFDKQFHVSPFMAMDIDCDWRFSAPSATLGVHMQNLSDDRKIFDATLTLERHDVTARNLARALIAYPMMTAQVMAGIYWQALRLWLKRIPFHRHPSHAVSGGGGRIGRPR